MNDTITIYEMKDARRFFLKVLVQAIAVNGANVSLLSEWF